MLELSRAVPSGVRADKKFGILFPSADEPSTVRATREIEVHCDNWHVLAGWRASGLRANLRLQAVEGGESDRELIRFGVEGYGTVSRPKPEDWSLERVECRKPKSDKIIRVCLDELGRELIGNELGEIDTALKAITVRKAVGGVASGK